MALSVVLASVNPRTTLVQWLAAFEPQRQADTELLVAMAGDDEWVRSQQRLYGFELVVGDRDALVPELWGLAMARAKGTIIAVTISACLPAREWVNTICAAHQNGHAAVGGVIEIATGASLVDRAVHLVRYTAYLPPLESGDVPEIAGDNGTYTRDAIANLIPEIERDGFWEPEYHRVLRERGQRLWLDPRILVTFSGSHSIGGFSRQRYLHGRAFGRARAQTSHGSDRLSRALLAPLVPGIMLMRALSTLRRRGRLDRQAWLSAPLAAWFFTCWAAGEAAGFLLPSRAAR